MNAELPLDDASKGETLSLPDLMRAKYPADRYALFFEVPDAVGIDSRRRIDAVAFGLWKSVGRRIEGFEFKSSRSDWLREVKMVDKADPFVAVCDFFWLVTTDSTIAKIEEIPSCWGWYSVTKTGLRVQRPATRLPGAGDQIPRTFVLGVLRKMQDDLLKSPEIATHIQQCIKDVTYRLDQAIQHATRRLHGRVDELQNAINDFESASGIRLGDWGMGHVGKIVRQLHQLGYGNGLGEVPSLLQSHENALRITLERVREARALLAKPPSIIEANTDSAA